MITEVQVRNQAGQVLNLPLHAVQRGSDYILLGFDGLGPVKASINTAPYALLPGSEVLSVRGEERSPVLTLGFSPYSLTPIQELRSVLYDYFMTGDVVELTVHSTHIRPVTIQGIIETNEPTMFSPTPSNTIGIYCSMPDFLDLETLTVEGNTVDPFTINYPGNTVAGMDIEIYFEAETQSITVVMDSPTRQSFTVEDTVTESPLFVSGDRLLINTTPGRKGVFRQRGGVTTSILAYKSQSSDWLYLDKGINSFTIATGTLLATYKVTYRPRYGGL